MRSAELDFQLATAVSPPANPTSSLTRRAPSQLTAILGNPPKKATPSTTFARHPIRIQLLRLPPAPPDSRVERDTHAAREEKPTRAPILHLPASYKTSTRTAESTAGSSPPTLPTATMQFSRIFVALAAAAVSSAALIPQPQDANTSVQQLLGDATAVKNTLTTFKSAPTLPNLLPLQKQSEALSAKLVECTKQFSGPMDAATCSHIYDTGLAPCKTTSLDVATLLIEVKGQIAHLGLGITGQVKTTIGALHTSIDELNAAVGKSCPNIAGKVADDTKVLDPKYDEAYKAYSN
ncbi:hypothetical protein MKEN_01171800 [Mycena kentingensis (nom. inval.)]|nr:hypothetical protein MKEN_01171800 [Mycena kentingensis (nom. inval.)]